MMKKLLLLTAVVCTATAFALPAAAHTVGCKEGEPTNETVKATDCQVWDEQGLIAPGYAPYGYAYSYPAYAYAPGYAPAYAPAYAPGYAPYAYAPRAGAAMAYAPAPRKHVSKTKKSRTPTARSPQSQPLPSLRDNEGLSGGAD